MFEVLKPLLIALGLAAGMGYLIVGFLPDFLRTS